MPSSEAPLELRQVWDVAMASDIDIRTETQQLGRPPLADFEVVVRNADGQPVVICNAAFLVDGTPMPTRYWLVDRELNDAVSRLESAGGVRAFAALVDSDSLAESHRAYAKERDDLISLDHVGPRPSGGVAGTAQGLKCLHAHYAYFLAGNDDPVGGLVHDALRAIDESVCEDPVSGRAQHQHAEESTT